MQNFPLLVRLPMGGDHPGPLYVDGQQDAMFSPVTTIDTNNFAVSFGHNPESNVGGTRNWNGDIDEVRISATAFDANRIFADHHSR